MGKLIYSLNVSLDGFVETPDHGLDWANVDEELHTWFNDQARTSSSLGRVEHNSRLVRGDVGAVLEDLRQEFDGDFDVAGPNLASQFVRRGLVDEFRLVVHPVVLGAGTPFWPEVDVPLRVRLVDTRTFDSGAELRTYVPS